MKNIIEEAWENRSALNPANAPKPLRAAIEEVIAGLDAGKLRVAEKQGKEDKAQHKRDAKDKKGGEGDGKK